MYVCPKIFKHKKIKKWNSIIYEVKNLPFKWHHYRNTQMRRIQRKTMTRVSDIMSEENEREI